MSRHSVPVVAALVTLGLIAVYCSVAPTRLTNANFGSDGGDFLAAILTKGIPHPTGYPTYTLLGSLFQLIPFSTPVFRAVLESLIPAALGAGLLTAWMCYVLGSKTPVTLVSAMVTGLAWGVAPLLFSQAVIIEVHGLQSLIVVIALWWLTLNLDMAVGVHAIWLLILSFLIGLGLGNHLVLVLFVPAAAFALIYRVRRTGNWQLLLGQVALLIAGMLVYLSLPLRAAGYPAINWGNPQTWSGFIWEVTANPYQGLLFHASKPVVWERVRSISSLLLNQFGILGLIAGVIGLIQYSFRIKWLRWILVWVFIVYLAFAIGYSTTDSVDYLIPSVLVFAIWIGLAIPSLKDFKWKRVPAGWLLIAILAVSIGLRIPGTRTRLDPRLQDQPARYAEQLMKDAPSNAIVYTTTDQDSFPLWYYHFGIHQRPDLRVIVLPLTQFVWYQQTMVHTYSDLNFPAINANDQPNADWGKAIAQLNSSRPVCNTHLSAQSETGIAFECSSP